MSLRSFTILPSDARRRADAILAVVVMVVAVVEPLLLLAVGGCSVVASSESGLERIDADPFSGGAPVIRSSQTLPTGSLVSARDVGKK